MNKRVYFIVYKKVIMEKKGYYLNMLWVRENLFEIFFFLYDEK